MLVGLKYTYTMWTEGPEHTYGMWTEGLEYTFTWLFCCHSLMIPIWELEGVCRTYIVGRVNSDALGMQAWVSAMGMWVWQCGHGQEGMRQSLIEHPFSVSETTILH